MKKLSSVLALTAMMGLAGCGLGGTFYAEPFEKQQISGSDFNAHLARVYQQRTQDSARNDVNWILAGMYAKKGLAAAAGEDVQPWNPTEYYESPTFHEGVTDERIAKYKLTEKHAQLTQALAQNKNANPEACAQAQGHYDWLVDEAFQDTTLSRESRHDDEEDHIQTEFNRWLSACAGQQQVQKQAPQAPNQWVVYFGWDRFDITAEARRVIADAVATAKSAAGKVLSIVGHTDTSGSDAYNQKLSQKRAAAVANAASGQGAANIQTQARGENDLAKQTSDNKREPLNRRAVIELH